MSKKKNEDRRKEEQDRKKDRDTNMILNIATVVANS